MALWVICGRLLNEVLNLRCIRIDGHDGACSYKYVDPMRAREEEPVDWDKVFPKHISK